MADLGSAEGGAVPGGGLGVCAGMPPPKLIELFPRLGQQTGGGGGYAGYVLWWLRHCRDPFYRFMVLGGGGGG